MDSKTSTPITKDGIAAVGETIHWEITEGHPHYIGKHSAEVVFYNEEEDAYAVYASYGQDYIGREDVISKEK